MGQQTYVREGFRGVLLGTHKLELSTELKDDTMENSINGIRIWHCAFAASIMMFSAPFPTSTGLP